MKFNGDSHFVIGAMHVRQNMPCQDHALSGADDTGAYITLSDGCSTGGETDTGSRILNYAAVAVLKKYLLAGDSTRIVSPHAIAEKIRIASRSIMKSMGVTLHDMQATLLYAATTPHGGFVHAFGDGCIVLFYKNGDIASYRLIWKQNMPLYLSYTGQTLEYFFSRHQIDEPESFVVIKTLQNSTGQITVEEKAYTAIEMVEGYSMTFSPEELAELKSIMVCSDGIENFKAHAALIDPEVVLTELTSIKQWQGEFIKRRVGRMLHVFSENGILPADDFSVAAIHIDAQIKDDDTNTTGAA